MPDDAPPDDDEIRAALRAELAAGRSRRDAAAAVAARLGVPRRVAYDLAVTEPAGRATTTVADDRVGTPPPDTEAPHPRQRGRR